MLQMFLLKNRKVIYCHKQQAKSKQIWDISQILFGVFIGLYALQKMPMDNSFFEEEKQKFGKRLKALRKKRNLTQIDLEVKCGIDNGDISRIENGQSNVELYTICKLADALEVKVADFFY